MFLLHESELASPTLNSTRPEQLPTATQSELSWGCGEFPSRKLRIPPFATRKALFG